MFIKIAILFLLYTALLSSFGMSALTVLRESRLFSYRSAKARKEKLDVGLFRLRKTGRTMNRIIGADEYNVFGGSGDVPQDNGYVEISAAGKSIRPLLQAKNGFLAGYKLRLTAILKNSPYDAGVDGLLHFKVVLGLSGVGTGLLLKNPFLSAVLLAGFFWLPDVYFCLSALRFAKEVDESVETAMSVVTNSYLQCEDIKSAVIENISGIDKPIKEIFREFLAETGFIDASVTNAILRMEIKADNIFFSDWCDILIQCQEDRELKNVLPSIVSKLSSVKRVQIELDNVMLDLYKEYLYVVGIVVLNLPLMPLLNRQWADTLFGTLIGKVAVALCFCVLFLSSAYVVSINRSLTRLS